MSEGFPARALWAEEWAQLRQDPHARRAEKYLKDAKPGYTMLNVRDLAREFAAVAEEASSGRDDIDDREGCGT